MYISSFVLELPFHRCSNYMYDTLNGLSKYLNICAFFSHFLKKLLTLFIQLYSSLHFLFLCAI